MRDYLAAMRHGFTGLLRFSGRDDSVIFWSYAATIIFLLMIVSMAGMIPLMLESIAKMQEFAMENPDQATIRQGSGSYSISIQGNHPDLMPDVASLSGFSAAIFAAAIMLLAAAISRRLHDTGLRGFWGLIPIPFSIIGTMVMPGVFDSFSSNKEPEMGSFILLFVNNLLYLGSMGLLLFLLLRKTKVDPADDDYSNINDCKPKLPARRRPAPDRQ